MQQQPRKLIFESITGPLIVGVLVALLVGGTAPWWWTKIIDDPAEDVTEELVGELPPTSVAFPTIAVPTAAPTATAVPTPTSPPATFEFEDLFVQRLEVTPDELQGNYQFVEARGVALSTDELKALDAARIRFDEDTYWVASRCDNGQTYGVRAPMIVDFDAGTLSVLEGRRDSGPGGCYAETTAQEFGFQIDGTTLTVSVSSPPVTLVFEKISD